MNVAEVIRAEIFMQLSYNMMLVIFNQVIQNIDPNENILKMRILY